MLEEMGEDIEKNDSTTHSSGWLRAAAEFYVPRKEAEVGGQRIERTGGPFRFRERVFV
jgi:hypothetical protein